MLPYGIYNTKRITIFILPIETKWHTSCKTSNSTQSENTHAYETANEARSPYNVGGKKHNT
jgi:hypothetical protein